MTELEFLDWLFNELMIELGDPSHEIIVAIEERIIQLEADETD